MKIQIAIAEDNSMSLQALQERLRGYPDIYIKYVAGNGQLLTDKLKVNSNLDLVLMDLEMPELDGLSTTKRIKQLYPHIKVLILTMFDDDEYLFESIMAGASGYLLKEDNAEKIYQAIQDTIRGGAAMSPLMALKTLRMLRQTNTSPSRTKDFDLTSRELEILTQLKNGLTYEEIASNLIISYHTVRKHIENIYRKLQVNNKTEAVKIANENRLTD